MRELHVVRQAAVVKQHWLSLGSAPFSLPYLSTLPQAALFHSIKPLFSNKPILIVCNKIDSRLMEELSEAERKVIDEMVSEAKKISSGGTMTDGTEDNEEVLMAMSTLQEAGIMQVCGRCGEVCGSVGWLCERGKCGTHQSQEGGVHGFEHAAEGGVGEDVTWASVGEGGCQQTPVGV